MEQGTQITRCLESADIRGVFLLDSVTALLSNEMWSENGYDPDAAQRTADELRDLVHRVENIVFVSDYLYSDARHYDEYTEAYRRALSLCDRVLAVECDTVAEVVSTNPIVYKGRLPI